MGDLGKDIRNVLESGRSKNIDDHALAVVKAAFNTIPLIGSSIASLIDDYVPSAAAKAQEALNVHFIKRMTELQGCVTDKVDKSQFAELWNSARMMALRTNREEKLLAAAAILANHFLIETDSRKLQYSALDHFIRALDGLSSGAIAVLCIARKVTSMERIEPDKDGNVNFEMQLLSDHCSQIDIPLLYGLVGELNAFALLKLRLNTWIRAANADTTPLQLTPLGIRFVDHFFNHA